MTMRDFSRDHRWLSINTATVRKSRGVELPLPEIIESCARQGIRAISPWRDQVAAAKSRRCECEKRCLREKGSRTSAIFVVHRQRVGAPQKFRDVILLQRDATETRIEINTRELG